MASVVQIARPFAGDRQKLTSHSDHRQIHRLVALLAAGLLVAACSGGSRSEVSPLAPPDSAATTMATTVPPAPKVSRPGFTEGSGP